MTCVSFIVILFITITPVILAIFLIKEENKRMMEKLKKEREAFERASDEDNPFIATVL